MNEREFLDALARVAREELQIAEYLEAISRGEAAPPLPSLPDGLLEALGACHALNQHHERQIVQRALAQLAADEELPRAPQPRRTLPLAGFLRPARVGPGCARRETTALHTGPTPGLRASTQARLKSQDGQAGSTLDVRVRAHLENGEVMYAATEALRALGPEVLGFLVGVLGSEVDADEVFAATSERFWQSLGTFQWRCSLRTWLYVIARHEIGRHRRGAQRHERGRVSASELEDVVAHVTTRSRSALRAERRDAVAKLREELLEDDRAILVLRVDRGLAWDEIALSFLDDPDGCSEEERRREAARLRKRFQLIKEWLAARARAEGLV